MAVDGNFDNLGEVDIADLVESGVAEGARLEFKRQTYGSADADKREFLKDISSFANTAGGHLVLGVDESDGVATSVLGCTGNPDQELLRMESLARDGLEPRVNGIRMRSVPLSAGGVVFVIRVPRSWNAPHRVSQKGFTRFYGRTSAGTYELSVEELRVKFSASAHEMDRAIAFHQRRLALLAGNEGVVPLAKADGRLTVHIVPLGGNGAPVVDLERALELNELLHPPGAEGWSPEFNFDGFANIRNGQTAFGYTQLFRDGAIEATKVRIVAEHNGVRRVPALSLGEPIIKGVVHYLEALGLLGVQPPLAVMVTLEGVQGAYLGYSQSQMTEAATEIRRDVLEMPPVIIDGYSGVASYEAALRPIFDAIWNAGGMSKCTYFDENGRWKPHN